jgi:hypothetical protein
VDLDCLFKTGNFEKKKKKKLMDGPSRAITIFRHRECHDRVNNLLAKPVISDESEHDA